MPCLKIDYNERGPPKHLWNDRGNEFKTTKRYVEQVKLQQSVAEHTILSLSGSR